MLCIIASLPVMISPRYLSLSVTRTLVFDKQKPGNCICLSFTDGSADHDHTLCDKYCTFNLVIMIYVEEFNFYYSKNDWVYMVLGFLPMISKY